MPRCWSLRAGAGPEALCVVIAVRCRCLGRVEVATAPWYGSDEAMCIVALTPFVVEAAPESLRTLVVLRPVTVEAMTTAPRPPRSLEPAHPIDSGATVAAEAVNEPADQNAADPVEDGEPRGVLSLLLWCDELAQ